MNKIIKFAVALMTAIAVIGCEKAPVDGPKDPENEKPGTETGKEEEKDVEYTSGIKFEIGLTSLEANAAEITITHNGTDDDTWCAFATTSTNVNISIEDKIEELTDAGGKITGLSTGTEKTIALEDLESDTMYTFIVFAITPAGDEYGSREYIRFTTPIGYEVNPAWNVEYTARQFIGENEYEHTVTVTSSDKNPYFMTVVTKDRFENTDIKNLLDEELAGFKEFIEQYNAYYEVETLFKSWCYTGTAVDAFGLELGHTYVAMAIGASDDGELTGHYAVSEEFQPYEEEMTPEYAAWLGNWTFTGANGVAFDVTFTKDKSNTSYIMRGWETDQFEVIVDWYPTENTWILWSQYIGAYTSPGYGDFDLYFVPANYVEGGQEVYATDGLPICIGCEMAGGERMVIGYAEDDKSLYTHMRYAGVWFDGIGGITATTDFPTFPLTVTPGATTRSVEKEHKAVSRKAASIYQPKKLEFYRF